MEKSQRLAHENSDTPPEESPLHSDEPLVMQRPFSVLPYRVLFQALTAVLVLAGCGAGSPGEPLAESSVGARVEQLERSGVLPALDRSDSLLGPDANGNRVRDDIEQWIATQGLTPPQQQAALQVARGLALTLVVDTTDREALQRSGERTMDAISCLHDRYKDSPAASAMLGRIEAFTMNTRQRVMRYIEYNKAQSGSTTALKNADTCEP